MPYPSKMEDVDEMDCWSKFLHTQWQQLKRSNIKLKQNVKGLISVKSNLGMSRPSGPPR
jgi:hypothetical protein